MRHLIRTYAVCLDKNRDRNKLKMRISTYDPLRYKLKCIFVVDSVLIVTPITGFCNCSISCCVLLYIHSSFASILMGKRELVALLSLSSWCLVIAVWLFLAVPWVFLQFVIVIFPDHTHYLFLVNPCLLYQCYYRKIYQNERIKKPYCLLCYYL